MYSVVLMAALTTAANDPACHHRCGCGCGCYSCGCYCGCGCYGCWGCGCYGCGCWGCGCYGCGCYGGFGYGSVVVPSTVVPSAPAETVPAPKTDKDKKESYKGQARLIVDLPEDAKLYIDDQLMKTPTGKRSFRTPALEPGQSYYYILKAEVVRDGKTQTETKRVIVRAGDEVKANFATLEAVATAKR